jgi:hypothetical protein
MTTKTKPAAHVLGREEVLARLREVAARPLPRETADVPELGGLLIVKAMDGRRRDAFTTSLLLHPGASVESDYTNISAKIVAFSVVDENDQLVFTQADVALLGSLPGGVLKPVTDIAQRLSGLDATAVKADLKAAPDSSNG